MVKAIQGLLSSGFRLSGFSRFMTFTLIILSLSMGMALVLTVSERNAATAALKSANTTIKEKNTEIEKKQKTLDAVTESNTGCQASLEVLNKTTAEQAQALASQDQAAALAAERHLANLNSTLQKDREVTADPVKTTQWIRGVFQ